ncbi:MAG: 4-hydroxythreonine-4-phosphate dehydrogenase PdxA [Bryobacteraceae bacterium]|nr:4-hydroxythreonine-4-phosphate dehydrogenase PdxA [Bryobacteraceae bacterium]
MIFGITMGDASGVGPEIVLKAYANGELRHPVVVFGDLAILEKAASMMGLNVDLRDGLKVRDMRQLRVEDLRPGEISAASGAAAREYVIAATRAALAGEIAAMVTLPMNKEATQLTDPDFVGHTELIGSVCGAEDVTIMLASDQLIVTHVSTHCSLREAIERAKRPRIQKIIQLTCDAVARLRKSPRIAVAGLNPHAGENGLFGREEIDEIRPAIEWAQARGLPVDGPFPPDTLFYMAVQKKKFDAIVCMYHDQGHVPLKLLDFEGGVNVALGLPIIRTSVDHGTAFDIAYKGVASTRSLVAALEFAAKMAAGPA